MPTKVTAQYLCDTLSADQLAALELTLKGRAFSYAGFLKTDQTLRSVVDLDNSALAASGITYQQIADKLHGIIKRLIKLHNEDSDQATHVTHKHFELDGKFHVVMSSYMRGLQSCPFEKHIGDSEYCDNGFSCYEFIVRNLRTQNAIHFGGLLPHLLEKHEFAQGPGCHYRLDPTLAAHVLEIEPGISYELPTQESKFWNLVDLHSYTSMDDIATDEMFYEIEALAIDYSVDHSARRFISNYSHRKQRTEDFYMHISARPGAKCNFSMFDNTRVAEPFYLENVRESTLFSFKQNKFNSVSLSASDKVLKKAPARVAIAGGGGASAAAAAGGGGSIDSVDLTGASADDIVSALGALGITVLAVEHGAAGGGASALTGSASAGANAAEAAGGGGGEVAATAEDSAGEKKESLAKAPAKALDD